MFTFLRQRQSLVPKVMTNDYGNHGSDLKLILLLAALRKQARHLENDIDLKLIAFNKVGTGSSSLNSAPSSPSDTSPLLGDHVFESLSLEIEQMLDKLSNINEKMAEIPGTGAAVMHVLQRHREILHVGLCICLNMAVNDLTEDGFYF